MTQSRLWSYGVGAALVATASFCAGTAWSHGNEARMVDVRVVCATHRNLSEMVDAGEFRAGNRQSASDLLALFDAVFDVLRQVRKTHPQWGIVVAQTAHRQHVYVGRRQGERIWRSRRSRVLPAGRSPAS